MKTPEHLSPQTRTLGLEDKTGNNRFTWLLRFWLRLTRVRWGNELVEKIPLTNTPWSIPGEAKVDQEKTAKRGGKMYSKHQPLI